MISGTDVPAWRLVTFLQETFAAGTTAPANEPFEFSQWDYSAIVQNGIFFILGVFVTWWFANRGKLDLRQQIGDLKNHFDNLIPYATHLRVAMDTLEGKTIEGEGRIAFDRDAEGNPTRIRFLRPQEITGGGISSEEEVPGGTIEIGIPPAPSRHLNVIPVVTKTVSPNPAYVGSPLTFHITLTNEGNTTAPDVTISDMILPNMDLVSVTVTSASGSDVSESYFRDDPTPTTPNGAVGCRMGDIPGGESATMDIIVIPRKSGTYRNHAGSSFALPPGVASAPSRNLTNVDVTVI